LNTTPLILALSSTVTTKIRPFVIYN